MSKRFTAEERMKIIEEFIAKGTQPEGFYIIKNKRGIYNIRHVKNKKGTESSSEDSTPETEKEQEPEKKKEPKPQAL